MIDPNNLFHDPDEPVTVKKGLDKIFDFQEFAAPAGIPIPRCSTKAKLEAGKLDLQGVMIRLPIPLRERLEQQTTGSMSVTICALVEFALNYLDRENKAVVVDNHIKNTGLNSSAAGIS
jgi:hypothetical protein